MIATIVLQNWEENLQGSLKKFPSDFRPTEISLNTLSDYIEICINFLTITQV